MDPLPECWSNLPTEILELIFERLRDPLDLLRCLGVCVSWHLVGRQFLRQHLPSLPPLVMFADTVEKDSGSSSTDTNIDRGIVFYNCLSRERRRFSLPEQFGESWLLGGSHGWLIATQREKPYEINLINAVSHAQIRLPKANGIIQSNRLRIVMSANPLSDPGCMILAIYPRTEHLAFCRLGDTNWTKLPTLNLSGYRASTFHNGHFYVYDRDEQIIEIELMAFQDPKVTSWQTEGLSADLLRIDRNNYRDRDDYLMESCGDLLLVSKYLLDEGTVKFKVHKLDPLTKAWFEVEDLGNRALFLGYNNSMSVSVPATDEGKDGSPYGRSTSCTANSIYFIDDSHCCVENHINSFRPRRGLYDMDTGMFKGWIPGFRPIWFKAPLSWIGPEV